MTPLVLPGDSPRGDATLEAHLSRLAGSETQARALADLVMVIAHAAPPIAARLALGGLPGDPARIVGTNDSGDRQKALDVAAHHHVIEALRSADVAMVLSEESEEIVTLKPAGRFAVAIDPIDGSGSIGIGAPLGLLFCVFPAEGGFLRPGRDILAAGYVSFGHSTDMGVSLGHGVDIATLDPASGTFYIAEAGVTIPEGREVIACNASNLRHWPAPLRHHIEARFTGESSANMRWIAAAVGDLHRILRRGGLFLYPADSRKGYRNGKLRLLYEAFPVAFLIEQAGGAATDGSRHILELRAATLHQHTPLIFGDRSMVAALPTH